MQKIFCDWGTSNLRAYLVDDGIVLKDYASNCGILKAKEIGFEKVLQEIFWEFQCAKDTSAILSGMVGAKQGWCEAPYASTPLNHLGLSESFIQPQTEGRETMLWVNGLPKGIISKELETGARGYHHTLSIGEFNEGEHVDIALECYAGHPCGRRHDYGHAGAAAGAAATAAEPKGEARPPAWHRRAGR